MGVWLLGSSVASALRQEQVQATDFDSFLVRREEAPTGNSRQPKKQGDRAAGGGPFESFLKVEPEEEDTRNPLDFSSFLKGSRGAPTASDQPAASKAGSPKATPKPEQARVVVMYGTEFGFSKEIAEKLAERLLSTGRIW
jgi:sulfite reductase (NADPH) flavoprotein alpha-component